MTIEIGTFTGCKNQVQKTFNKELTLDNVTLKDSTDVITPSILLKISSNDSKKDVITSTYAYIPVFKRYYYVTNATVVRNTLFQLDLRVDVLMSFSSKIYEQTAYIKRTESPYQSSYLRDDQTLVYSNVHNFTRALKPDTTSSVPNATTTTFSNTGAYVFITAGPSGKA